MEEILEGPSTSATHNKLVKKTGTERPDSSYEQPKRALIEELSSTSRKSGEKLTKEDNTERTKELDDGLFINSEDIEEVTDKAQRIEKCNNENTGGEKRIIEIPEDDILLEEISLSSNVNKIETQIKPKEDGWLQMRIKRNNTEEHPDETDKISSDEPSSECEFEDIENEKEEYNKKKRQLITEATERVRSLDFSNTTLTFNEMMSGEKKIGVIQENESPMKQEFNKEDVAVKLCATRVVESNQTKEISPTDTEEEFFETVESFDEIVDEEEYSLNILYNNWVSCYDIGNIKQKNNQEDESSKSIQESSLSKSILTPEDTLNEEMVKTQTMNDTDLKDNEHKLSIEEVQKITDYEIVKLTAHQTIQDILREDPTQEPDNGKSDYTDSENDDNEEDFFYKKLDKSDITKFKAVTEINDQSKYNCEDQVTTKEQLKTIMIKSIPCDDEEKQAYKEILKWDLKIPTENIQILKPIQRHQPEKPVDEISELLARSSRDIKPEFEYVPPKDIVEENDVIKYPSVMNYKSIYTECGIEMKKEDVKPPLVHQCLTASANYPVFQMNNEGIVDNEIPEDEAKVENSIIMCNKISEVREEMAEFSKNLKEFPDKFRCAAEEIIKDHNKAVERGTKNIDKMTLKKDKILEMEIFPSELSQSISTNIEDIDDNAFGRHFKDMGIDIIRDNDDDAEIQLNEELRRSKEELYNEIERIKGRCLEKLVEESETSDDEEENAKEIVKTQLMHFIAEESNKNNIEAKREYFNESIFSGGAPENEFWQGIDIESETNAKETTSTEITDSEEISENKSYRYNEKNSVDERQRIERIEGDVNEYENISKFDYEKMEKEELSDLETVYSSIEGDRVLN